MKIFLGVLFLVAASLAEELTVFKYHERIGIPKAAELKIAEEKLSNGTARIVGGEAALLKEFTYTAGLLITLVSSSTSMCGATLISNTRLLTAANCWWDGSDQARYFTVVLGSVNLHAGGTRIITNTVDVHESYNPFTGINNVMMVTIPWVPYSVNIGNVGIPTGTLTYAGSYAVATGYGINTNNGAVSNSQVKSFVWTSVITNAVCTQSYGSAIVAGRICTSGAHGVGICDGDSGGPLVIESGTQRHLIGIALYGSARGCQAGLPSVYLRVTSFLTWINARL